MNAVAEIKAIDQCATLPPIPSSLAFVRSHIMAKCPSPCTAG